MDANYRPFHPSPAKPVFVAPPGAVDAHCHVFGPASVFPYAPARKYTPCDAPKQKLFELRDFLGFSRNVIVQATCHGHNNDALVDALHTAGDRARGVASVSPDITDAKLDALHGAGVRAVRFNFVKRLVDNTPRADFLAIARRVAKLGWHCVVYFEAADLAELTPFLCSLPTTIVIDHMGRPDVTKGVAHPDFSRFVSLMADNDNFWTKVSCPERLSASGPPYADVVSFSRMLVDRFPHRVLWGTDWPHPNMNSHMPDDGTLVDMIPRIATDAQKQHALLVENPEKLYWA
jgi:2-pyrone-4,6-dicarboxylate lactonase